MVTCGVLITLNQRYGLFASLKLGRNILRRNYTNRNILKLRDRGIFQEIFPPSCPHVNDVLSSGPQCFYAGFDPTSNSLHIGNLLVIMALLHCQRAGHSVIALLGAATAKIGDPSGRNSERNMLETDTITANARSIESSLRRIFKNHEDIFWGDQQKQKPLTPLKIVNNLDWYSGINVIDFLSTVGRYLRLGDMLAKDSVRSRLSSPDGMSLTEFTYQAFQAYDWLHLNKKYGCLFQIGGSDQLGNIHSGYDLIKKIQQCSAYGLTVPLITSETGDKLGKSAGNAISLNSDITSPFEFYQYCLRLQDSEVEKYLKLFTFYQLADINQILDKHKRKPESRYAQKKIAEMLTLLLHGEAGLHSALRVTEALYSKTADALAILPKDELLSIFKEAPTIEVLLNPGTTVLDMAMKAQCFASEKDAHRIISAGGFYVNHQKVTKPEYVLIPGEHILPNNLSLIRVGKRNYYVVKWIT